MCQLLIAKSWEVQLFIDFEPVESNDELVFCIDFCAPRAEERDCRRCHVYIADETFWFLWRFSPM
jgi:hypothetical protein